jgi:hypothetical protein
MKKYYIIQSTKTNKNGHVSHLMVEKEDGVLYELSPKTGRELQSWHCYWTLEEYLENEWEVVELRKAIFTGGWRFPFIDYLEEKGLIK